MTTEIPVDPIPASPFDDEWLRDAWRAGWRRLRTRAAEQTPQVICPHGDDWEACLTSCSIREEWERRVDAVIERLSPTADRVLRIACDPRHGEDDYFGVRSAWVNSARRAIDALFDE